MIEEILKLYRILVERTHSVSFSIIIFIGTIIFIFLIDYCFNFSYSIFISHKLNNLETVNKLKPIYANDSINLNKLLIIEDRLTNKRHYSDLLFSHSLHSSSDSEITKSIKTHNLNTQTNKIKQNKAMRSKFWMVISSNYFLIFILVFFLFISWFSAPQIGLHFIIGWFAAVSFIILWIFITTWIAYQIPVIMNNSTWNYILNAIIHFSFSFIIYKLITKTSND